MGFNSYLLVVADFINRARHNQIPVGPGRWSAAGSLVAWIIGITDVDPLPFGLLFERFLNPARVSMPDIDTDFDDEQRERVFEYVKDHYGAEHVAKIGTFMNLSAKAAFKDVARVMWVPFDISNRISSFLTILNDDRTVNFRKCREEVDELKVMLESDEKLQEIVEITDNLIGTYRQTGVHACGIVIWPDNLTNYLPQQLAPNTVYSPNERNVTQYDYGVAKIEDTIGVIKMDFLGLSNLSIIKNTIKIIEKRYALIGKELPQIFKDYFVSSTFEPPLDDKLVYETIFQKWNTSGIFQFESEGMKRFLILLKPDRLDDVVSMSALYRPGPIEFIPSFIRRKHGEEPIDYMYPELYQFIYDQYGKDVAEDEKQKLEHDLKPILETTYGVAVFQEQLMFMSQSVAWFSFAQADNLRRWIGKKIVELVKKIKQEFIEKAQEIRWYKSETANWVFEKMIEPAALYSFNKSHSVAYSLVAFQTAYLKTYYPIEFHAALLRANEGNTEELSKFINEIKFQWLKIFWPDINESYVHVAAIEDYVRLWFLCIKGVWSEVAQTIQDERQKNWNFKDLADFLTRCQSVVNKKSLEGLIKSWALDKIMDRAALLENSDYILERAKSSHQISDGWLFGWWFGKTTLDLTSKRPLDKMSILKLEYDVFKTFISFHPLDGLYPRVKSRGYNMISQFKNWNYEKEQADFGPFTVVALVTKITRAKKKWFFIKIEDFSDSIEFFVKEPLDIHEFDLLIISWYRGKWSARWKKIIKANLERLIQIASNWWKYNPEETVFEVKKRRLGMTSVSSWQLTVKNLVSDTDNWEWDLGLEVVDTTMLDTANMDAMLQNGLVNQIDNHDDDSSSDELPEDLEDESDDEQDSENAEEDREIIHEKIWWDKIWNMEIIWDKKFTIPNDIQKLKQLQGIIKQNPGENKVLIGSMNILLSDEGLRLIEELLGE
jgi:DNA polymerase-3 subunit alpha